MSLVNLRKKIDEIDYKLHDLLNERAKIALQVGKIKVENKDTNTGFYRPEREREILEKISKYNKGPLSDQAVANIFKTIMSECLLIQKQKYPQEQNHA